MYFLAFFTVSIDSLDRKIGSWLKNNKNHYIAICKKEANNKYHLASFADILASFDEYFGYERHWCICSGNRRANYLDSLPELPVRTFEQHPLISFDKIDRTLVYFAKNYRWSILPWGLEPRCGGFVFISQDSQLRDRFVNSSIDSEPILISTYDVTDKFSATSKFLLFSEDMDTIEEVWDAFACDNNPPYLISDRCFDRNTEFISITGEIEKDIDFTLEERTLWFDNFYIHRANSKKAFLALCNLIYNKSRLFIWVDGKTNLDKLEGVMGKIYYSNSDLAYLSDILECTEWFYGLDRDFFEYFISLIACRDNKILQEINIFRGDCYTLLGCF